MAKLKIGDKAPDFTLKSSTGEGITLSQFFGKKNVVLFFYPRDEGPTCVKEAELLEIAMVPSKKELQRLLV